MPEATSDIEARAARAMRATGEDFEIEYAGLIGAIHRDEQEALTRSLSDAMDDDALPVG